MATPSTPSRRYSQETRERIRVGVLIDRLQKHAEGTLKYPMTPSQIKAAEILLKKKLPDLQSIEMSGELSHGQLDDNQLNVRLSELLKKLAEKASP